MHQHSPHVPCCCPGSLANCLPAALAVCSTPCSLLCCLHSPKAVCSHQCLRSLGQEAAPFPRATARTSLAAHSLLGNVALGRGHLMSSLNTCRQQCGHWPFQCTARSTDSWCSSLLAFLCRDEGRNLPGAAGDPQPVPGICIFFLWYCLFLRFCRSGSFLSRKDKVKSRRA